MSEVYKDLIITVLFTGREEHVTIELSRLTEKQVEQIRKVLKTSVDPIALRGGTYLWNYDQSYLLNAEKIDMYTVREVISDDKKS